MANSEIDESYSEEKIQIQICAMNQSIVPIATTFRFAFAYKGVSIPC